MVHCSATVASHAAVNSQAVLLQVRMHGEAVLGEYSIAYLKATNEARTDSMGLGPGCNPVRFTMWPP